MRACAAKQNGASHCPIEKERLLIHDCHVRTQPRKVELPIINTCGRGTALCLVDGRCARQAGLGAGYYSLSRGGPSNDILPPTGS